MPRIHLSSETEAQRTGSRGDETESAGKGRAGAREKLLQLYIRVCVTYITYIYIYSVCVGVR